MKTWHVVFYLTIGLFLRASADETPVLENALVESVYQQNELVPCTCGVFLSGQFIRGSADPPKGNAALMHELEDKFPCTLLGNKQCTNKCLDIIVKHLPNSAQILCGSIDRDCHKERAYLFVKNCKNKWINSNLSAGREYCCKDGIPYKCPII